MNQHSPLTVRIYFEDESPRLGCGWRWVTAQIGRKWVRLQDSQGSQSEIHSRAVRETQTRDSNIPI
jgi:hypothetical protein